MNAQRPTFNSDELVKSRLMGMNNVGRAIALPIVVGDSPPYEFYAEFLTF